jgi:signal peptidase I
MSSRRAAIIVCASLAVICGGGAAVVMTLHPLVERHRVPSESMTPAVQIGDVVSVNARVYRNAPPAVGDVVIFHPPRGALEEPECGAPHPRRQVCAVPTGTHGDEKFMKRVVGGPGDRLTVRHGHVILNGKRQTDPYTEQPGETLARPCHYPEYCDFPKAITVPANHFFLMGDNRASSDDSRSWGPVPREWIVGRVERCSAMIFACSPQH